jgi:hypothetical protein
MTEQIISRDSLDVINNSIIKEEEPVANVVIIKKDDSCCCSDNCFKWWFFHSSFQATRQSIIEESLLKKTQSCVCCNICGDCVELKIKNCCITNSISEPFIKEYCSDCFYNGCQITCCCFTIVLASN